MATTMYLLPFLAFHTFVLTTQGQDWTCNIEVDLTVVYESVCKGSWTFILQQLSPVLFKKYDWLHVELIPYGVAKMGQDGQAICVRKNECLMNRIHLCSFQRMSGNSPEMQWQRVYMADCLMKNADVRDPFVIGSECAVKFNIEWDSVIGCATGPEGMELERTALRRAMDVHAPFVPYIAFNQQFGNNAFQNTAIADLLKVVNDIHCGGVVPSNTPSVTPRQPCNHNHPCPCPSCPCTICYELPKAPTVYKEDTAIEVIPVPEDMRRALRIRDED